MRRNISDLVRHARRDLGIAEKLELIDPDATREAYFASVRDAALTLVQFRDVDRSAAIANNAQDYFDRLEDIAVHVQQLFPEYRYPQVLQECFQLREVLLRHARSRSGGTRPARGRGTVPFTSGPTRPIRGANTIAFEDNVDAMSVDTDVHGHNLAITKVQVSEILKRPETFQSSAMSAEQVPQDARNEGGNRAKAAEDMRIRDDMLISNGPTFPDSTYQIQAAETAVNNPVAAQTVEDSSKAIRSLVLYKVDEVAARRKEASIRAEIIDVTHKLHYLLQFRNMLSKMHTQLVKELEGTRGQASEEVE